jgi:glycosyltransferase involved in cell wall biosynthesis
MSLVVSTVVCTHNRAAHLALAIQSLVDQHTPKEQYEIIVVNNCSTDDTPQVVEQFLGKANINYVYESTIGLSHARNRGWQSAKGKYIAYLDDDAIASPDWISTITETFESNTPRPGCVGGKVVPMWEAPRPHWLSNELVTCLTAIDWSDTPLVISDLNKNWLVGANIAFPIEILRQLGGFVLGLDRAGKNLLSGGDVYLQKQIAKAGYTCYYQPKMLIRHFTAKSRLNQQWFMRRYYWQGLSDAAMQIIEEQPSIVGRLRLASPKILSLFFPPRKMANLVLPRHDKQRFTEKCFSIITVGHIVGLLGAIRKIE